VKTRGAAIHSCCCAGPAAPAGLIDIIDVLVPPPREWLLAPLLVLVTLAAQAQAPQLIATAASRSSPQHTLPPGTKCDDAAVANAACFGFDASDSTSAVRAALATNKSTVVIPRMSSPWILGTMGGPAAMHLLHQQNMTIILQPGAQIQAKRGDFRQKNQRLFLIEDCHNITILAYGSTMSMWRQDYANLSLYVKSEWRAGLAIYDSQHLKLFGLNISESGGDGLTLTDVRNVYVKDAQLLNNYRQGLSMIAGINVTVEDSLFAGTNGTWPKCGCDIEPDNAITGLVNITFRRVVSRDNQGCGFSVAPGALEARPQQMSIRFENCIAAGNAIGGFTFQGMHGNTSGTVDIVGGSVRDQSSPGLIFFDKHPRVVVTLSMFSISNVANQGPGEGSDPLEGWWLRVPVAIQSYPTSTARGCCHHPWNPFPFGGVVFGEGVEVSHSRTNSSSLHKHWPWLRAYHIDARPTSAGGAWTDPGNANITGITYFVSTRACFEWLCLGSCMHSDSVPAGTVRVYTSTPEAICPGVSIDDHGPQRNVTIDALCNDDAARIARGVHDAEDRVLPNSAQG
jgi:hypothetical protein